MLSFPISSAALSIWSQSFFSSHIWTFCHLNCKDLPVLGLTLTILPILLTLVGPARGLAPPLNKEALTSFEKA